MDATIPEAAKDWPSLLFDYGPYAVCAVFVFIVVWLLIEFRRSPEDDAKKRFAFLSFAIAFSLATFACAFYIIFSWPPRTVYEGSFGRYDDGTSFYSTSDHLYIGSEFVMTETGNHQKLWKFAVITDPGAERYEKQIEFTYLWIDGGKTDHNDYEIPFKLLKAGRLNLFSDPAHPGVLLYHDIDNPSTPAKVLGPIIGPKDREGVALRSISGWTTANAQESNEARDRAIIGALNSSDPYSQAQGRSQLRRLSDGELSALLQRTDVSPQARREIEAEQQRRRG